MTTRIAILYVLFALISTAINIATQAAVFSGLGQIPRLSDISLPTSVVAGTGAGLVSKYLLDKRWIFQYKAIDATDEARAFIMYTVMGVVTTAIYLVFEFVFHWLFRSDVMRYLGASIGLAIGYFIKYRLDRRYSFKTATEPFPQNTADGN
jgi:putative flippase GtrA